MALTNPLYNALPQLAYIQGFWRFEDNFNDLSDNGYTLSEVSGTIPFDATGKIGKAADFELGDTEYLQIAHASCPNLQITGDLSISAWIKPESSTAIAFIVCKYNTSSSRCYALRMAATNEVVFMLSNDGTNTTSATSTGKAGDGSWTHVACTFDRDGGANNMKVYINGSPDGTATFNNDIRNDADADFTIGAMDDPDQYFDGLIDEVIVWNCCLSPTEVSQVYAITTASQYHKAKGGIGFGNPYIF